MADERGLMELPAVRGWVRPPVDIPVYELSNWSGPRSVLIYQGKSRLEELKLAFGEVNHQGDPRLWIDVATHAKLPRMGDLPGAFTAATSFAEVAGGVLMLLPERTVASLPPNRQRARAVEFSKQLVGDGAMTIMSEHLPAAFWTPVEVLVDDAVIGGYSAALPDCWAVCVDVGQVYVSVTGNGIAPCPVALSKVEDLRPYRMA